MLYYEFCWWWTSLSFQVLLHPCYLFQWSNRHFWSTMIWYFDYGFFSSTSDLFLVFWCSNLFNSHIISPLLQWNFQITSLELNWLLIGLLYFRSILSCIIWFGFINPLRMSHIVWSNIGSTGFMLFLKQKFYLYAFFSVKKN